MKGRLAIIAGRGDLPHEVARAVPHALFVTFTGFETDVPNGWDHFPARFEELGALFENLHKAGCTRVVFAGIMSRPHLNPAAYDATTTAIMPDLIAAMAQGDDALLRQVARVFEAEGFEVEGAHQVAPALTLSNGDSLGRAPNATETDDFRRARDILEALGHQDVTQSAVVENGQCLGIESLQGTDAMLRFVAETPAHLRRSKGVFVKAAKQGQDRRFDLPTIGPQTIHALVKAELAGLFIPAGGVIVLKKETVFQQIRDNDLFLVVY